MDETNPNRKQRSPPRKTQSSKARPSSCLKERPSTQRRGTSPISNSFQSPNVFRPGLQSSYHDNWRSAAWPSQLPSTPVCCVGQVISGPAPVAIHTRVIEPQRIHAKVTPLYSQAAVDAEIEAIRKIVQSDLQKQLKEKLELFAAREQAVN